jgi:hypothetical protein
VRVKAPIFILVAVAALITIGFESRTVKAQAIETRAAPTPADAGAQILQLEEKVKRLEGLVPSQPTVMTHVGYHFANLWFAAHRHNWPLAQYYLGEVRSNLKWAVRVRPVRPGPGGDEVNVAGIAEAVDNTQLANLETAIHDKRSDEFVRAYDDALVACYACHKAIGKPWLRPRRPAAPEVGVMNFDPAAKWPQ